MKQTILFVTMHKPSYLPPFLALIDRLLDTGLYSIKVAAAHVDPEIDELYNGRDVEFFHIYERKLSSNSIVRKAQILKYEYIIHNFLKKCINEIPHDILWVIHELTAVRINDLLKEPFILSTYELNDDKPHILKKLKPVAQRASVNVVCEYNRGQILKLWFKLKSDPIVLPNKPYYHPLNRNIATNTIVDSINEKIILYQGYMDPGERNLSALCDAVDELDGYKLVLMGRKTPYAESLIATHNNIAHVNFIKPPKHLNVTSHAHIGIVTYSYQSLNTVFCAPNKIWEYSGFGLPMIGNDLPGLKYTIEANRAGICVDTDNKEMIKDAIIKITNNYEEYVSNSLKMYYCCDVSIIIDKVINAFYAVNQG